VERGGGLSENNARPMQDMRACVTSEPQHAAKRKLYVTDFNCSFGFICPIIHFGLFFCRFAGLFVVMHDINFAGFAGFAGYAGYAGYVGYAG
jgi:hypothetical protein